MIAYRNEAEEGSVLSDRLRDAVDKLWNGAAKNQYWDALVDGMGGEGAAGQLKHLVEETQTELADIPEEADEFVANRYGITARVKELYADLTRTGEDRLTLDDRDAEYTPG